MVLSVITYNNNLRLSMAKISTKAVFWLVFKVVDSYLSFYLWLFNEYPDTQDICYISGWVIEGREYDSVTHQGHIAAHRGLNCTERQDDNKWKSLPSWFCVLSQCLLLNGTSSCSCGVQAVETSVSQSVSSAVFLECTTLFSVAPRSLWAGRAFYAASTDSAAGAVQCSAEVWMWRDCVGLAVNDGINIYDMTESE